MPKVEANQSKRQEVIAEKQGLTGSEIHSSSLNTLFRLRSAPRTPGIHVLNEQCAASSSVPFDISYGVRRILSPVE